MSDFVEFPKIARLNREMVITEKIDGTNAQIFIENHIDNRSGAIQVGDFVVWAGSRTRWLSEDADNHGFWKWVRAHADELVSGLGVGRHFGEWWGAGIQRGYGLQKGEKRFSLFNTSRWADWHTVWHPGPPAGTTIAPACCYVVPEFYRGKFDTNQVAAALEGLRTGGSIAAPGFMRPEGVVVYHTAGNHLFKVTLEKDEQPKSRA